MRQTKLYRDLLTTPHLMIHFYKHILSIHILQNNRIKICFTTKTKQETLAIFIF